MAASRPNSGRWLFGPVPDLLLGCGGLYALVLLGFAIGGPDLRAHEASWLGPLLVLLLGAPHYGATLLRVYEHRSDRRAYMVFSIYATIAIAVAFGFGLWSQFVASWLVTIYLSWSPWHYTGQNYGLAVLFLRRRNVEIRPLAKRLLYGSFILSYALTFLIFHGETGAAPTPEFAKGPRSLFISLDIPVTFTKLAFPVLGLAYAACIVGAGTLLARGGRVRDLFPSAIMVLSQALWFTIPVMIRHLGAHVSVEPFRWDLRDYYFFWIALGHATQYLWVTTFYARESDGWRGYGRYLGKIFAAGVAIWTLPVVLFDPNQVGALPNSGSLALLVASVVNIHHFILDGAIWKLRSSRIANVLIRRVDDSDRVAHAADPISRWQRRTIWAIASAGCVLALFKYANQDVLFQRALDRRDFAAARRVLDRISWVSEVNPAARKGLDRAERALAAAGSDPSRRYGLVADPDAQLRRGNALAAQGEWREAARAFVAGLEVAPDDVRLLRAAAGAWLELGRTPRAIRALERAAALSPGAEIEAELEAARARGSARPARAP